MVQSEISGRKKGEVDWSKNRFRLNEFGSKNVQELKKKSGDKENRRYNQSC